MKEISKHYFNDENSKGRMTYPEVEKIMEKNNLEGYIATWKKNMYMKLLEIYSKKSKFQEIY